MQVFHFIKMEWDLEKLKVGKVSSTVMAQTSDGNSRYWECLNRPENSNHFGASTFGFDTISGTGYEDNLEVCITEKIFNNGSVKTSGQLKKDADCRAYVLVLHTSPLKASTLFLNSTVGESETAQVTTTDWCCRFLRQSLPAWAANLCQFDKQAHGVHNRKENIFSVFGDRSLTSGSRHSLTQHVLQYFNDHWANEK